MKELCGDFRKLVYMYVCVDGNCVQMISHLICKSALIRFKVLIFISHTMSVFVHRNTEHYEFDECTKIVEIKTSNHTEHKLVQQTLIDSITETQEI